MSFKEPTSTSSPETTRPSSLLKVEINRFGNLLNKNDSNINFDAKNYLESQETKVDFEIMKVKIDKGNSEVFLPKLKTQILEGLLRGIYR